MSRRSAWSLVFLACFALQVPWVRCVASCHDRVHPDVGRDGCHAENCDTTDEDESHGTSDSSRSESEHLTVSLVTVGSQQLIVVVPDLLLCPDLVVMNGGPDEGRRVRAALRRMAEPDPPAGLSAVLLL